MPEVSIIIDNFGNKDKLIKPLEALRCSDFKNFEIIITAVLSPGIELWLKEKYPECKLIHFDTDIGPTLQRNKAMDLVSSSSRFIIFLDNDIIFFSDALNKLITFMKENPNVGAAQPILLKPGTKNFDSKGGILDRFGYSYDSTDAKLASSPIFYAAGAVIVKREVIDLFPYPFSPYDPSYFMIYDDVDLSWRIRLLGYLVATVPESFAYHYRYTSDFSKWSKRTIFLNTRNRVLTLTNYSLYNSLLSFSTLFVLEFFRILASLALNKPQVLPTILGYINAFRSLKAVIQRRSIIHSKRKVTDDRILQATVPVNIYYLFSQFKRTYKSEN